MNMSVLVVGKPPKVVAQEIIKSKEVFSEVLKREEHKLENKKERIQQKD